MRLGLFHFQNVLTILSSNMAAEVQVYAEYDGVSVSGGVSDGASVMV